MKYIIFKNLDSEPIPVIFDRGLVHSDIARLHSKLKPIAAGFFNLDEHGHVKCWGFSSSLNLGAREVDKEIIRQKII